MLKLYYTRISGELPEAVLSLVSEYRKEKLRRIKDNKLRNQGLFAELLLNHAVSECFPQNKVPYSIKTGQFGKPYFGEIPLFFSLSHSGSFAACAVSQQDLGLDIQEEVDCNLGLARRFFSENEYDDLIHSAGPDYDFTRLWTLKESYIKAIGKGLQCPLNSFSVQSNEDAAFWHGAVNRLHFAVCIPGAEAVKPDNFEYIKLL